MKNVHKDKAVQVVKAKRIFYKIREITGSLLSLDNCCVSQSLFHGMETIGQNKFT